MLSFSLNVEYTPFELVFFWQKTKGKKANDIETLNTQKIPIDNMKNYVKIMQYTL